MTDVAKSKGGGVFGFIKDAFVESVPDAGQQGAPPPAAVPTGPAPSSVFPQRSVTVALTPADSKAKARLEAALVSSMPAVYSAFNEQLSLLAEVIPDENLRVKAALKTSKTSIEQLTTALDSMAQTLQGAKAEFDKGFEEKKGKTLSLLQAAIATTDATILDREQQIAKLQQEIEGLHSQRLVDAEKVQSEERRLTNIRAGFDAAYAETMGNVVAQKTRLLSQAGG